ncbi:MAG: hypothetical protein IKP95_02710 [Ruminococcus sp.]|nr:hypothetical protein [Ruminococcus sp.]
MKKRTIALLCAAAIMLTACTGSDADGSTPASANGTESRVTIDTPNEEYSFTLGHPKDSFSLDTSAMQHIKASDDTEIVISPPDKVYKFDYSSDDLDYNSKRDAIGRAYLGSSYNSCFWKETQENIATGFRLIEAVYQSEDFPEVISLTNCGNFVFQPQPGLLTSVSWDGVVIQNDDTMCVLSDKSKTSYSKALERANALIKGFDEAVGRTSSREPEVSYDPKAAAVKVEYRQVVHELDLCKIRYQMLYPEQDTDHLGLWNTGSDPQEEVYLCSSDEKGYYIKVMGGTLKIVDKEEYDKMITLQSALEYLDSAVAVYFDLTVKKAELKYLLTTEKGEVFDDGSFNYNNSDGIPVWEIILYNQLEHQDYAYVMNVLNGEYSLVKLKANN